jgi:hypothetical protein
MTSAAQRNLEQLLNCRVLGRTTDTDMPSARAVTRASCRSNWQLEYLHAPDPRLDPSGTAKGGIGVRGGPAKLS